MAHDTLVQHRSRQAHANAKIAAQEVRMGKTGATDRQKAEDAQLMNEMRHKKAAIDLNRALFDYDADVEKV